MNVQLISVTLYVVLAKICGEKSLRFSISRKRRAINVDRRAMIYSMYLRFIGALCIGYGRQGDWSAHCYSVSTALPHHKLSLRLASTVDYTVAVQTQAGLANHREEPNKDQSSRRYCRWLLCWLLEYIKLSIVTSGSKSVFVQFVSHIQRVQIWCAKFGAWKQVCLLPSFVVHNFFCQNDTKTLHLSEFFTSSSKETFIAVAQWKIKKVHPLTVTRGRGV